MWRILFLVALAPVTAAAAGLDITADELTQDSYGTVIASGNVVVKQRPVRVIKHLHLTPTGWQKVQADFDLITEPAETKARHRQLILNMTSDGWKITADRIIDKPGASTTLPYPSIKAALETWRQAWSSRDLKQYFAAYAPDFQPDNRFTSLSDWQAYKKRVIKNKQYIKVSIEDIRIRPINDREIQVEFLQHYSSDRNRSRDIKQLVFKRDASGWHIIQETVIDAFSISAKPESHQSPEQAVAAWKNAWNRRDLEAYTGMYTSTAYPLGLYENRQAWLDALKLSFAKAPTRSLKADRVKFNRNAHRIRAEGNVEMQSAEGRIVADAAEVDSETHAGSIEQATVYLPDGERLLAAKISRINDSLFEAHDARFSSCPTNDEAWALRAKSVRLDQQEGELTARSASFEVGGVPLLYSPWWSQTLKRKSGLLTPKVGTGKRRGTELGIPWYFAPADNWDATLTPTWMSARGVMGEAEARHISRLGHERINVAGINDAVTGSTRSRLQSDIAWHLPRDIELAIRADHVSDHLYLADYATGSDASTRYLKSIATLSQAYISDSFNSDWILTGQHQQDMTLDSNATTLQILPRLESRMQWQLLEYAYLHMDQQTTRFARVTGQDGWRMDLHPYVELPWQLAGGGLSATLQAGGHFTHYWLQGGALNIRRQRTTGEASLELRSDFERISSDTTWRHQVSPVLRYDYINAPDQSNMANFDSTFGRLTWSNLLTGNRFTGHDRIEKINRISVMLETRLQHKDGLAARELLLFRAGAAYDMLRQSVDPALQATATRPFSNLLAELTLTPMQGLRLFASGQYNPADRYWPTLTSSLDIAAGWMSFHAGYQLTDARYALETQLLDLSATIRLGQRWQASGQWQYDNLLKLTQQTTLGLKYSHPCWSLGIEGYRLNRPNGTAQSSDFGARILLEFKGLGSVGSS